MKNLLMNKKFMTTFIVICGAATIFFFVKGNAVGALIAVALLLAAGPFYAKAARKTTRKTDGK